MSSIFRKSVLAAAVAALATVVSAQTDVTATAYASASEIEGNEQVCNPEPYIPVTDADTGFLVSADVWNAGTLGCDNSVWFDYGNPYGYVLQLRPAGYTDQVSGDDIMVTTTLMEAVNLNGDGSATEAEITYQAFYAS